MNLAISIFPIALLIYLMTKKKSMPSWKSLPLVAVLLYLIKVFYFGSDLLLINATVINGLLTAWTPILIIWGAIFLFRTMENSGDLKIIREWLNNVTDNKIAQLMIIGWAFAFLIEGASGFGTPAALAAPLLVGLGFKPLKVAIVTLMMNTVPVTFGAVGTPIWFGLGQLGLSEGELITIGAKVAIMHTFAALFIPLIALTFIVPFKEIKKNLGFIYLSIFSCVIPYFVFAQYNFEFPAILGGSIGLVFSVIMARHDIGLDRKKHKKGRHHPFKVMLNATFPLWGTVAVLLITRIKEIGIKPLITSTAHAAEISVPAIGDLSINPALVLQWNNILGTSSSWIHKTLYVPSIIPFFAISFITFWFLKTKKTVIKKTWNESWNQIKKPILSLLGALVFVKLLMADGDDSMTLIIGSALADVTGAYWQFFASYLGGLGAFFSGSNTVSNLTFGGIQQSIAESLNLNVTTILAAQAAGGAMGNMICINNIVAVCSVLGLQNQEGRILKSTILPFLGYGVIIGTVSLILA